MSSLYDKRHSPTRWDSWILPSKPGRVRSSASRRPHHLPAGTIFPRHNHVPKHGPPAPAMQPAPGWPDTSPAPLALAKRSGAPSQRAAQRSWLGTRSRSTLEESHPRRGL